MRGRDSQSPLLSMERSLLIKFSMKSFLTCLMTTGMVLSSIRAAAADQPKVKATEDLHLRAPETLSKTAREMLRHRMERHGDDMVLLMATVLMLNYPASEQLARNVAREPRLARPLKGELDTLNAQLPLQFFELQDQLTTHARSVADAAHAHQDVKLVKAYGSLAETCVGCHSVYLREAGE